MTENETFPNYIGGGLTVTLWYMYSSGTRENPESVGRGWDSLSTSTAVVTVRVLCVDCAGTVCGLVSGEVGHTLGGEPWGRYLQQPWQRSSSLRDR